MRHNSKISRGYIFVAVLTLSFASHGLVLQIPMPQPSRSEVASESESLEPDDLSEDLTVVVLPKQTPSPEPVSENASLPLAAEPLPEPADEVIEAFAPEAEALEWQESAEPVMPETDIESLEPTEPEVSEPEPLPLDEDNLPTPEVEVTELSASDEPKAFVHPEGAVEGCADLAAACGRVDGGNYRQRAKDSVATLQAQGYTVRELEGQSDTGYRVYEALQPSQDDIARYLTVISQVDGSVWYFFEDRIITPGELDGLA